MYLQCTQKLLKQLGLSKSDLDVAPPPSNRILAWHAHIVSIARSKTFIAVNDQTLYAVIIPQMKKKRLECLADEFRSALSTSLRNEGFQDHHLGSLFGERICYAKTFDRQVLGIINESVYHIRFLVERWGGWEQVNVVKLTKEINRTPWLAGTRRCVFPIERLTEDLKSLLH